MAYRDDKEAAYARADALQRELDRAQAELERTKGKLAETERARDSLAKKLSSRAPQVFAPPPPPMPARRAGSAAIGSLFVIGAMSAFALNSGRHHYASPSPPPSIALPRADLGVSRLFTLKSDPPGAKIYAKRAYGEELVGTTPMTRSLLDWSLGDKLELRLDGYRPTPVNPLELPGPFERTSSEMTITLDR